MVINHNGEIVYPAFKISENTRISTAKDWSAASENTYHAVPLGCSQKVGYAPDPKIIWGIGGASIADQNTNAFYVGLAQPKETAAAADPTVSDMLAFIQQEQGC